MFYFQHDTFSWKFFFSRYFRLLVLSIRLQLSRRQQDSRCFYLLESLGSPHYDSNSHEIGMLFTGFGAIFWCRNCFYCKGFPWWKKHSQVMLGLFLGLACCPLLWIISVDVVHMIDWTSFRSPYQKGYLHASYPHSTSSCSFGHLMYPFLSYFDLF